MKETKKAIPPLPTACRHINPINMCTAAFCFQMNASVWRNDVEPVCAARDEIDLAGDARNTWQIHMRDRVPISVVAGFEFLTNTEFTGRFLGDESNGAPFSVLAEQRTLGSAEHLDPLYFV